MECANPSCKCQSIPKVRDGQYEDWTVRSAETKARFGTKVFVAAEINGTEQTQETRRPRCWKCEQPDPMPHEWHDDGTANTEERA